MKLSINLPVVITAWAAVAQTARAACPNLKASYGAPVLSDGWEATLIANDLTAPRGIIFDTDGGLLVVDKGVGIVQYKFTDGGSGCLDVSKKTSLVNDTTVSMRRITKTFLIHIVEPRHYALQRWKNVIRIIIRSCVRLGVRCVGTLGQRYEPDYCYRNE